MLIAVFVVFEADAEPHTPFACWDEPRIFSSDELSEYSVLVERVEGELPVAVVVSPNNAYSFVLSDALWDAEKESFYRELLIYNERPYLLKITMPGIRDVTETRWINEKLLYIRVWRGQIAGADLIIDVEKEAVVHNEGLYWGQQAFQQHQYCSSPGGEDKPSCRCELENR